METIITSEQDLRNHKDPLPEDILLFHFKLVSVGPETLKLANRMGKSICEVATKPQGYFIIGSNNTDLRKAMHDLVDRFCDIQEKKV